MKNVILLFICILSCSLLSCQDETEDRGLQINENGFQLSYTIPKHSTLTRSKVTVEEGEDRINTFYALFFENVAAGAGQFLTGIDLMEGRQSSSAASGIIQIDYSTVPGLKASGNYKILLCANIEAYHSSIEDFASLEAICSGKTEREIIQLLQVKLDGAMDMTNLPMSASVVKQGGQKLVSVNLTRAVSRFDVVNQVDGYELKSASLWNAYPSTLLWENGEENFSGNHIERFYGVDATTNQIIGGLYGFENFVESPAQNDAQTTAVIVEMTNLATGNSEFFRINIHPENQPQELKRNNIYCSIIQEVLGNGFSSEKAAYESNQVLLSVNINGWMGDTSENIVYDEDNILALPTGTITLAITGDERTYNIFTHGEGTLQMTTQEIPDEVKVNLNGKVLSIEAPSSPIEWTGVITFSIGNLTASMQIRQAELISNYLTLNYGVEELPLFDYNAGSMSPEIDVMSSGAWKAEIYNGASYFSFGSSATSMINGEANTNFTIKALKENKTAANRYCFVHVSLVDFPEVNQVLVLEQAKYEEYLRFNPDFLYLPSKSQILNSITLESNAEWDLYVWLNPWGGPITFMNDKYLFEETISGKNTKQLTISVSENDGDVERVIYIEAKTRSGKTTAYLTFRQAARGETPKPNPDPTPEKSLLFVSNGLGNGNLVSSTTTGFRHYVYLLGSTLHDKSKFGKNGSLVKLGDKDPYQFTSSFNSTTIPEAKIIQLLSNPTESNFNRIWKNMQADPTAFLMITSTDYKEVTAILKQFKAKSNAAYGSATSVLNTPGNIRPMNSKIDQNHPLVDYLLKKGPGGSLTAGSTTLQGNISSVAGLAATEYPSTFVPIIMANANNNYCVFGIDPVNRLIIMTDPGIFGCAPGVGYPSGNNYNYTTSSNWKLLNNIAAWIVNATATDGFLQKYQKK